MSWNPQQIADLRRHWGNGLSAAEIAAEMTLSRNAVLAKAHRLGLARKTGTEAERFEALTDIVANAPLGTPITILDAAMRVGIPLRRATDLWSALAARYGEEDIARDPPRGDRLVIGGFR